MLGHKARNFRPLNGISLEDLVPEDNFYRHLEGCLDLSFVHDLWPPATRKSAGPPLIQSFSSSCS